VQNRPELVAAEFALNEGGGGLLDEQGRMIEQDLVVAEKTTRNYRLETTNPGGHSSIPVRDNAIYELADALVKVRAHEFPMKVTPINQAFFAKTGAIRGEELGRAMKRGLQGLSVIAPRCRTAVVFAALNGVLSSGRDPHRRCVLWPARRRSEPNATRVPR